MNKTHIDIFAELLKLSHNKNSLILYGTKEAVNYTGTYDFIYIEDSNDYSAWWQALNAGGTLSGYDEHTGYPGIVRCLFFLSLCDSNSYKIDTHSYSPYFTVSKK